MHASFSRIDLYVGFSFAQFSFFTRTKYWSLSFKLSLIGSKMWHVNLWQVFILMLLSFLYAICYFRRLSSVHLIHYVIICEAFLIVHLQTWIISICTIWKETALQKTQIHINYENKYKYKLKYFGQYSVILCNWCISSIAIIRLMSQCACDGI